MSDIISKTYDLLDALDASELIKKLTTAKVNLNQKKSILLLIENYQREYNIEKKIKIKQELFKDKDYKDYTDSYNELSSIILRINKQYQKYTDVKEHKCSSDCDYLYVE